METMKRNNIYFILVLLLFSSSLAMSGCVSKEKSTQDELFKEWEARAQNSQPYLPARKDFSKTATPTPETSTPVKTVENPSEIQALDAEKLMAELPSQVISVRFVDDQLSTVLRTLARLANQNILLSPSVQGTINTHINNTPWNKVFMSLVNSYGLIVTKDDNLLHVMSIKDLQQQIERKTLLIEEGQVAPLITKVVAIEYSTPKDISDSITLLLSTDKEGKARGSVSVDAHSRSIIIRDTDENMNKLLKLVYDLDQPTPQILIKAHIVEASKDTARELGVKWGANSNPGETLDGDFSYSSLGDFSVDDAATLGVLANGPDISLDLQLSALQKAGKINILSSPSIATLDNNQAIIESGTTIPYPSGIDEKGNIVYDQAKATLKLTVTPHVISENSIKLDIQAQKDEVDATRTVGGTPYVLTKNAETKLIVPNTSTVVIAGLTKEKNSQQNNGVPFLMDIPVIGELFKYKKTANEFEDLLIFITPTILTKSAN